jgi:serine phosphatase RsbU (regulator of sigma subunit)
VVDDVKAADRMRLLYDLARDVGRSFDETAILQTVVDRLFDVFPQAETAAAVLYDASHDLLVPKASRTRRTSPGGVQISRSLIREVMQTRSGVMTSDAVGDERFQDFKTLHDLRLRALLCVPMISGEEVYGVIQLAGSDSRLPFSRGDMLLLLGIAGQTALALANANLHRRTLQQELFDKDLDLATKIQRSFLPQHTPEHERYRFAHRYTPALQVGGDFYGYLEPGGDISGVAVGDVSGKGVSAALYMARLASEIRYLAVGQSRPAPILERLNEVLVAGGSDGMFVTLILCIVDTKLHRMAVANAGHHPPVVCSGGGTVISLPVPGNVPLGVMPGAKFEEALFELDPGDTVVLYTDGVNEAESVSGEQFGASRVTAALLASDRTPEGAAQTLYERVQSFAGDAVQSDDIAVVAFGPKA